MNLLFDHLSRVIRVDLDERAVEYLASSSTVFRDRSELCPVLWGAR